MFRRAFRQMCRSLGTDSAHVAVTPFLLGKCGSALLLASFWAPVAAGSPLTAAPISSSDISSDFLKPLLITSVAQPEFRPASVPRLEALPAQGVDVDLTSAEQEQSYECYPYLLLTTGLILLAFRPASPATAGRH